MSESQAPVEAQQVVEREVNVLTDEQLDSLADMVFQDEVIEDAPELETDHNDDPVVKLEEKVETQKEEEKVENSNILALSLDKDKIKDLPSLLEALPEDLVISHKFDGEVGEFSLKKAIEMVINNESGMKTVHKRMAEVDKREKAWYNEKQDYLKSIEDLKATAQSGNMVGVSAKLLAMLGYAPHTAKAQLMAELRPEFERLYSMTEDEIRNERLREENEYYSKQNETRAKQRSQEQAVQELRKSVATIRETHDISDDEWSSAFNQLNTEIPKDQDFTYKEVAERVLNIRQESQVNSKLSSILDGFNDLPQDFVSDVTTFVKQNPSFSVEAIRDSISKAISDADRSKKSAHEQELAKELVSKVGNKKQQQTSVSVDELEDLSSLVYRDED